MSEMAQNKSRGRKRKNPVPDLTTKINTDNTTDIQSTPQAQEKTSNDIIEVKKQEVVIDAAIDERLNAAIAASNYRIILNNQRQNARLALQKGLTYSINGGVFNIDTTLIALVQSFLSMGKESTILLDVNQNPVEIESLEDFRDTIVDIYYEKMNEFLVEFKSIARLRNPKSLIGE